MACFYSTMSGASAGGLEGQGLESSEDLLTHVPVVDDMSAERLAGPMGCNIHMCPFHMAWAFSQYSGCIPRMSLLRDSQAEAASKFL